MQAALVFAPPGPAAGSRVVALGHGSGARPAADRRVALRRERVLEQLVVVLVPGDVVVGPRRDRVDLHDAAADVEADDRRVHPGRRLDPAQPGHPGLLAVERAGERLDLAHRAALVGIGLPEIVGRDQRLHDREVEVVALTHALDVPVRLGEVVLRVEEHDFDLGHRRTATSMSTQSWNDAASTTPVPKRSHAHFTAADAGLCSSSAETAASSPRSTSTSGRDIAVASRKLMSRALAVADFGDVRAGLAVVDEELGPVVGSGEVVEVLDGLADALGATRTGEPLRELLAGVALLVEATDDAHDRFGRRLGRQLRGLVAELDLHVADVTAEQHLVAGRGATVGAPLEAEEADVGDVVLAAAVGAAGDVGAHTRDLGEAGGLERVADRRREAAGLRDREVAGVGAGAGDDVAGELGAGLGHADLGEAVVERPAGRLR